ncbi:unnamed protein product, partial [marine sediment metagenome]
MLFDLIPVAIKEALLREMAEKHENITCYGEVSHDEKKEIMGRARA